MDIDVMGKHIHGLLAFKDKIEKMIAGAGDAKNDAHDELNEILAFKNEVRGMLPLIEKTVSDASLIAADLAAIKKDLEPALAWIAEQQKAIDVAKGAEVAKAEDAAKAQAQHEAGQVLKQPVEIDEPVFAYASEVEPAKDETDSSSQLTLDQVNATTKPPAAV